MKKILSWGLMLAAAFTLTNCAKEITNPDQQPETAGYPFEISASVVDTKTVNDGMSTKWVAGDKINLFHAVCDGTDYKNDGAFTISNVDASKFGGSLCETLDVEEEYDWYAIYPYSDKITTPGERTSGYIYIGYSSGLNQTGYDSMASLKGSVCPLYGVAKYCAAGTTPSIDMYNLASVVAINITNATEEPLTVTTASLTAEEDLVGSYYIDITKTPVVYTPSSSDYVKNTAIVNVSGGTALAKGESAVLYLAIKPFTAATDEKLVLSVNGYEKELTMTKDVTFSAGKIKTLNFLYDKETSLEPEDPGLSGEWLITGTESNKLYAASAYVSGNNLGNVVEIAIVDDKINEVDGLAACKMTITKVTDGTYAGLYTIKDTKNQYLYAASASSNNLKAKSTLDANSYWNISQNSNGTYSIIASESENRNVMQFNGVNKLFGCYATASQSAVTLYPYSMVIPDLTPRIKVADTEKEVAAEGGTITFTYTLANLDGQNVSVSVSDPDMLSASASDGVVTVVVAENTGEARSATVTLSCGSAEPVVLSVSQLGVPVSSDDVVPGAKYTYTFTSTQFTANGTKTLSGLAWTISGNGGYWGYDGTKGQQFGSGNKPYKELSVSTSAYSGGVQKIVINTSGASSISAKLTVTVGGVAYGSQVSLTTTATSYTFNAPAAGMQAGDIVLKYTQTSSKAIYIKSITIN